jgi:CHAD domain-containing protein
MLPGSPTTDKKAGLAHWAQRALEECDKASQGFAADPVHDLRVAIRRCRSLADGFLSVDPDPAWKEMKRLGKPLFSSLGELRDTQVMLEWIAKLAEPGDAVAESLNAELLRKEAEQKIAAQTSLAGFDSKQWLSLNMHLAHRTGRIPVEGLVFQHVALERWTDARELHRRALKNRSAFAYHQLRIGIKRFRYTVENFLPERHAKWSKELRNLQDALGEVHDLDVLRGILQTHAELSDADRSRWLDRISAERQKRLDLYREKMAGRSSLWNAWRAELPSGDALERAAVEKLRTWAAFLDPDLAHSSLVTKLALQLFDGLTQCGTLQFPQQDRRLLEAAGYLHEVGRHSDPGSHGARHLRRGERKVLKLKPPLGWTLQDIQAVAVLVRYHRGPLVEDEKSLIVGVTAKRRRELMGLLAVLRLANALDEPHQQGVDTLKVEGKSDYILVVAHGLQEFSETAQRVARARYLLETLTKRPILIRAVPRQSAGTDARDTSERVAAGE